MTVIREPFESALIPNDDDDEVNEERHYVAVHQPGRSDTTDSADSTDTKPIKIPDDEADADEDAEYVFRRHWREPVLRLLPGKHMVRGYGVLGLIALAFMAIAVILHLYKDIPDGVRVWMIPVAVFGLLLLAYPLTREIYRWRKRLVIIWRENGVLKVLYREPDNIFLLFNGDGDGNVTTLEGSTEINIKISWANRLIFWGCGDLLIAGKVEGGSPVIENVPRVKYVRAFMSGRML